MKIRSRNSSLLSALWSGSCTIFVLFTNTWTLRGACALKLNNDAKFVKGPIKVNYLIFFVCVLQVVRISAEMWKWSYLAP